LGIEPTAATPSARHAAEIHRIALAAAKESYAEWQRALTRALTDQYWEFDTEVKIAAIGYRAICRRPDLYTPIERDLWADRLAAVYHKISTLENDIARVLPNRTLGDALDLLTNPERERERIATWYAKERSHETHKF
jgi:hypothetical protein